MSHIKFGYCLPIFANPGGQLFRTPNYDSLDAETTMKLGTLADELKYDSLWVADHLMLGKDEAILEGWTVLSALAGATQHAKLGMIHQGHYFRHPALAARMAATLDQISGGRLIHFYDVGTQKREHHAYGFDYPEDERERIASMVEGLNLMIRLWTTRGPVDYRSDSFQLTGAVAAPGPAQQPHPPIWLGEDHPDVLRAAARFAQGWNSTPVPLSELRRRLGMLREACTLEGRAYDEIEKSVEMQVLIAGDVAGIQARLSGILSRAEPESRVEPDVLDFVTGRTNVYPESLRQTTLIGMASEIEQQIRAFVNEGVNHFMLWFIDAPDDDGMKTFAKQVVPAFRTET